MAKLLKTKEVLQCNTREQAEELVNNFQSALFPKLIRSSITEENGTFILTVEKEFGVKLDKMKFD